MQGKVKEEWMLMCEQAAVEQDSEKLMVLITEINRLLDEKERPKKWQAREIALPKRKLVRGLG